MIKHADRVERITVRNIKKNGDMAVPKASNIPHQLYVSIRRVNPQALPFNMRKSFVLAQVKIPGR